MKHIFNIIFCFNVFLFASPVFPQAERKSRSHDLKIDQTEHLQPVPFDKNFLQEVRNHKDYDYSLELDNSSWWSSFKSWLSNVWNFFLDSLFKNLFPESIPPYVVDLLKAFFILVAISLIVWLYIRLNPGKAWVKTKRRSEVLFSEDDRIIRTEDIPKLIAEAEANMNFRLAIRYYYLLILKQLKDAKWIDYKIDKTNKQYKEELKTTPYKSQFNRITKLYDFIWYGDFNLKENEYAEAKLSFENIRQNLQKPKL